jgi:hypothetical protein
MSYPTREAPGGVTEDVGCYDLRGPDFETLLVGPITGSIIDAARMVREGGRHDDGWHPGFPVWDMYRTAYAGDTHLVRNLRTWCQCFGVAYVTAKARPLDEAVGSYAGRDAFIWLTTGKWGAPPDELADGLGIAPKTYRAARNAIAARLNAALREYWMRLEIAMREVALLERRQDSPRPLGVLHDGTGWDGQVWLGDGNLRAMPKKSS